jgi:hypothetical protein
MRNAWEYWETYRISQHMTQAFKNLPSDPQLWIGCGVIVLILLVGVPWAVYYLMSLDKRRRVLQRLLGPAFSKSAVFIEDDVGVAVDVPGRRFAYVDAKRELLFTADELIRIDLTVVAESQRYEATPHLRIVTTRADAGLLTVNGEIYSTDRLEEILSRLIMIQTASRGANDAAAHEDRSVNNEAADEYGSGQRSFAGRPVGGERQPEVA